MTTTLEPEASTSVRHTLQVLDHTGDTRTIWNPENQDEVDAAKTQFDKLVKEKRYLAYTVKDDGSKGEVIRTFDPTAGKIIMAPQIQGG